MNAYDLYTFYIEAADLKSRAHKVKVESVEVAEVFNPGKKRNETKILLHLAGKKKVLSLNKTRTKQMIEITGTPEVEQWTGAEIMIEPTKQSGKDTISIKASTETQSAGMNIDEARKIQVSGKALGNMDAATLNAIYLNPPCDEAKEAARIILKEDFRMEPPKKTADELKKELGY